MSEQCEHTGPHGQCSHPKVDGSDYCARHSKESDRIQGYRLSSPELRKQFEHFEQSDLLETVRQEISLLRALINDRLNMLDSPAERIAAFQSVAPQLVAVVKSLETIVKLEHQTNVVLGKDALRSLAQEIIKILTEELVEVPDHDSIIDRVAKRIASAIAKSHN